MATNKKKAVCDCCKRDKLNLSSCSGDVVCSSCGSVYGALNNRLPILASAVERLGKADALVGQLVKNMGQPWLMTVVQAHLPERVAVNVENETLDQVAKLVGYTGESGEGLLAVIAELAGIKTELDHFRFLADSRLVILDGIAAIVGVEDGKLVTQKDVEGYAQSVFRAGQARIAELEQLLDRIGMAVDYEEGIGEGSDREGLIEEVSFLNADRNSLVDSGLEADMIRALGLPEGALWSTAKFAAIQTAAFLEYYQVESVVQAVEVSSDPAIWDAWMLRLRDLLGMPVSRPSELIDAVEGKLDELEECRQRCEQLDASLCEAAIKDTEQSVIFIGIGEAIGQPNCQPAELASYCKSLVDSAGRIPSQQFFELDSIRQALGVTDPRYNLVDAISEMAATRDQFKKRGDRYGAEKNILADQLADLERIATNLEQTNTVNEQIFARIRELMHADGVPFGELPSVLDGLLHEGWLNPGVRINERLSDRLMASEAGGALQTPGTNPVITDALVDFALRALSGKITLVHQGVA